MSGKLQRIEKREMALVNGGGCGRHMAAGALIAAGVVGAALAWQPVGWALLGIAIAGALGAGVGNAACHK